MPDYIFAFMSAILWAVSAPVINYGLEKIPDENPTQWISIGLFIAMGTGVLTLSPFVYYINSPIDINFYLILSGIFTFPLATGAYYLSSHSFSKRAEFASLFSKVKPLLSFALAVLILGESISQYTVLSALLVTLGIALLFVGVKQGSLSGSGVALGLLTALSWSVGEVLMKQGIQGTHPIVATWVALISGMVVFSIIAIPMMPKVLSNPTEIKILWPFCLHGCISFGVAYSLFFYSVDLIGLGRSALINAFWPILGVFFASMIRFCRARPVEIPSILIWAAILLLAGSLVQAIFEF